MSIEAMKQAREALLDANDMALNEFSIDNCYGDEIALLEKAIEQAEKQEPVAWRNAAIRLGEELSSVGCDHYYDLAAEQWLDWALAQEPRGKHSLPAPSQAEKQEPVAWISEPMVAAVRRANPEWYGKWQAELTCTQMFPHQIPLYTAPPKREWVGLTDEEVVACWARPDLFAIAHAIESKLKERNT